MELAAAKLALSIVSPIINMLGSYVYDTNFGGDVTAEEMRNLNDVTLFKIKTVIQEAQLVPLDHLRPWLENLQAAAFEAEDLIDLYEYKKIKNQVSSLPEPIKKSIDTTKEYLRFMLPKSSFKICLEKLQKSAEEAEKLLPFIKSARKTVMEQLKYKSPQASSNAISVSTLSSPLFGREKESDIIIQMLLDDESHAGSNTSIKRIPIIAVKGIGGSGKTAIAQGVYNDQRVETYFDLRMWVHVSRSFDVHRLTKEIIESAANDECPQISNLDVLQTRLKELISNAEKFLLVLDDIWCNDEMQWNQLLSPLNEVGGKGSKVIITTPMEVASILQVKNVIVLKELKTEDCWSILKHYAFDNFEKNIKDQELVNIGNQIINKVKHSPLALRVVGSLLGKQISINEWEKILKQDMLKETMDVLLLSFQHLPSHLQRCFAYCSLFPKGYRFSNYHCTEILVPLWIAQGFVENTSETELTLEEKGSIYFKELLSYSFFEKRSYGYYMIHDLLHDLAEKVSKKHCHRIEDHDSLDIPATCIHLSMCMKEDLVDMFDVSKLRKLRTLIILSDAHSTHIFKNKREIFQNLTKLRAFHVESDLQMEVVSNPHMDKLKHLRYLHLHYDKKLPEALAKLYHLQFFYLSRYGEYRLPGRKKANNLPDIEYSVARIFTTYYPPEKVGMNGMILWKNLPLRRLLGIKVLENVESKTEAAKAKC